MKTKAFAFICTMLVVLISSPAIGIAAHGQKRPLKKGILLVAFGSSIPEARTSFRNIEKRAKAAFPAIPIRWAYTSSIIRHKLAKEGTQLDSVELALAKMMDEDFTHVAALAQAYAGPDTFVTWHRRLGHLNHKKMRQVLKGMLTA